MRAKPIPAIPSSSAASGNAGVEAGLRALLDAFSHAFHDHKPLGECAIPLDILLHTSMPPDELQRLVTAGLVRCCAEKEYPAEWPRLAEAEKEVGRSPPPPVVLLDIGMPKMNGSDAARHSRRQSWGRRPVLGARTGWGQEEDKRRARAAGFEQHRTTPVDPAALEELLAQQ
jgi:CheY-like chemotaxis protein